MGNSNGTLADYWDAIESTPGLQGGFIWEFWDHGLIQTLPDGRTAGPTAATSATSPTTATSCATAWSGPTAARSPRCGSTSGWRRRFGSGRGCGSRPGPGRDRQSPAFPRPWLAAGRLLADRRRRRDRRRDVRAAGAWAGRAGECRLAGLGRAVGWLGRGVPDRSGHDRGSIGLGTGKVRGLCRAGACRRRPCRRRSPNDRRRPRRHRASRRRGQPPGPGLHRPTGPRALARTDRQRPDRRDGGALGAGRRRPPRAPARRHRAERRGDRRPQRLHDRGRHRGPPRGDLHAAPAARSRWSRPSSCPTPSTTCRASGPCWNFGRATSPCAGSARGHMRPTRTASAVA